MAEQKHYYSNPGFCQQSEFYQRCKSPLPVHQNIVRQSPVGAQTPARVSDFPQENYEEQDFYEEMLVDDAGFVKEKKIVVVSYNEDNKRYAQTESVNNNLEQRRIFVNKHRYEEIPENKFQQGRYEYIPMQEQEYGPSRSAPTRSPNRKIYQEEVEMQNGRVHRYAVIPADEETDFTGKRRYTSVPFYEPEVKARANLATQKLHELLSTPKRERKSQKIVSPQLHHKYLPQYSPPDPFVTPPKRAQKVVRRPSSKVPQKLNYPEHDKKHTAIVSPRCTSPVYSDTTISRNESWMNLSINKSPIQATLAVAAVMMILCGGVSSGLCFYMVSFMGRLYYLDFGIVSGFACLLLGLLGFRTRTCYWLPNRNFISGYIILSVFSLLTCVGLLLLLFMQPKPGTPLADMTSGAVCGISVLSLVLASSGVVASYCCKYPPPDNRVEHCARGFTV